MGAKLRGIPASSGLCLGRAYVVSSPGTSLTSRSISPGEVAAEIGRWNRAAEAAAKELERIRDDVARRLGEAEASILGAQAMMLSDPTLAESVHGMIRDELVSAEKATIDSCEEQATALEALDDPYFAARGQDMRDIGQRLVRHLQGGGDSVSLAEALAGLASEGASAGVGTAVNTVLVAEDLAPSEAASLDPSTVAAIVLQKGGKTSHTAILARSFGIPLVAGVEGLTSSVHTGDTLMVDGDEGTVVVNPDEAEAAEFDARLSEARELRKKAEQLRDLPAVTRDGKTIELAANIGSEKETQIVKDAGATGVGLFRTEFLFIDRTTMPTEEEQYEVYKKVLSDLKPYPVVIRTLDAGGDKHIPYLNLEHEDNPFLGLRAIRLCLKEKDVFRTQLRALLRASVHGTLRIMFPMIATLQELRDAKAELAAVAEQLKAEGVPVADDIQVGIMVEIPSAALQADALARECDFFSIGTNDLVQYTMACDRGNSEVSYLSDPFHPAVLSLINHTIEKGHEHGIWVGMCGEMAGSPLAIPLLVGMGIDELSMAAPSVLKAKEIVRGLDVAEAREIWDSVRHLGTNAEVKGRLSEMLAKGTH
jgi:phosphotransferase system enzyme I (PtsI)